MQSSSRYLRRVFLYQNLIFGRTVQPNQGHEFVCRGKSTLAMGGNRNFSAARGGERSAHAIKWTSIHPDALILFSCRLTNPSFDVKLQGSSEKLTIMVVSTSMGWPFKSVGE